MVIFHCRRVADVGEPWTSISNYFLEMNVRTKVLYFVTNARFTAFYSLFGRRSLSIQRFKQNVYSFCAYLDQRQLFLYLLRHKTQLSTVILQKREGRFFWGILRSRGHRKVANPATTNSSFTDPIHESFLLFVSFFINKHKGWTYFFWPHPPFYTSWLQFTTPTD